MLSGCPRCADVRQRVGQDLSLFLDGFLHKIELLVLLPFFRARAVRDLRINVFALHKLKYLFGAKIVARSFKADLLHNLNTDLVFHDINSTNTASYLTEHVVGKLKGHEREAE